MLKSDVIKFFGSSKAVWERLGMTSGAVSQWGKLIPEKRAMQLDRETNGKLKYKPELYKKPQRKQVA
ncbi:MAG: Cro/Cl family transcriptional regulator [Oceanobacter sp.]